MIPAIREQKEIFYCCLVRSIFLDINTEVENQMSGESLSWFGHLRWPLFPSDYVRDIFFLHSLCLLQTPNHVSDTVSLEITGMFSSSASQNKSCTSACLYEIFVWVLFEKKREKYLPDLQPYSDIIKTALDIFFIKKYTLFGGKWWHIYAQFTPSHSVSPTLMLLLTF